MTSLASGIIGMDSSNSTSSESDRLLRVVPSIHRYSRRDSCVQYREGASWLSASFIMANIIVGVGLLNFPAAYRDAGGLTAAIPVQMVCMVITLAGMLLMVHCSDLSHRDTYQDVVDFYCGGLALVLCNGLIIVHNLGTCITLLVILADQMDQVLLFGYGADYCHYWYLRRSFTLPILTCILILPFCFPEKMDTFKYVSVIGVATTVYIIALSIWKYYTADLSDVYISTRPDVWLDFFKVVPVLCFAFEAHVEAVPLYSGFKERRITEFAKAALVAYSVALFVYTTVGVFGYLTFGEKVKSDMLMSYNPIDAAVIIAIAAMALKSITSYPVIFYCVRLVIDDVLERLPYCQPPVWTEFRRRICHTTVLVIASLLLALLVPTIGSVIALLGGTASIFLFVFPGV